jgi:hypothetical protein
VRGRGEGGGAMSASLRRSDAGRASAQEAGLRHFLDLRDFDPATLR